MECRSKSVGGVSLLTQRRRRRKKTIVTSAAAMMMMTVFLFRSLDLSQALTCCSFLTSTPSSRAFRFFAVHQQTQSDYGTSTYVTDFNSNNIVALTSAVPRSIHSSSDSLDLTQLESPLPETSISEATKQHNYVGKHTISNLLNHDIRMDGEDEEDDEKDAFQPASGYLRMSESAKLFVSQVVHTTTTNNSNNYRKPSLKSTTTTTTTTTTTVRANVQETGNDALSSYLKNIANHDLLRHEDEIALGRQIQILVNYEQHRLLLEQTLLRKPTFNEWAQAVGEKTVSSLKTQIRRSQRAKAAMMEANLRNVVSIARQIFKRQQKKNNSGSSSSSSFQDLCQQGIIGLAKACERFDPEKGVRFITYANWYIKQEVTNSAISSRIIKLPPNAISKINTIRIAEVQLAAKNMGKKPSDAEVAEYLQMTVQKVQFYKRTANDAVSLNKELLGSGNKKGSGAGGGGDEKEGATLEDIVKDPGETPADIASKQMLQDDVRRLIGTLSPKEQAVIRLRYGLDDGQTHSLEHIGLRFAVSKERIRNIETSALQKLRQPYRHESVKGYVSDL
mmetsp:Transcript_14452/g.20680  ORF Transcript_14452/g.20680 Transcript_14452/m.20680 type:complete len:562 (-) Transcript_14452:105-1790(-)